MYPASRTMSSGIGSSTHRDPVMDKQLKMKAEQWWDPYETCHGRQFVFRPNSAAEVPLCPMSTSFMGSSSRSGHFGSTVYRKEFCWKAACKPEHIHTGTPSGQKRNNPHPSQAFMTWRLPMDAMQNPEYVQLPWKCPPSEGEIQRALTALYRSTYRCDFTGCDDVKNAERPLAPLHSRRRVPRFPESEMRDSYRQPRPKIELMGNRPHYSCNTDPSRTRTGIVPTVVQRHVLTQQRGSDLTAYDSFCGKRDTNVTSVVKSLFPQELHSLLRTLPAGEKEAVKTLMSKDAHPHSGAQENKLPAVVPKSCSPERISSWPGPI